MTAHDLCFLTLASEAIRSPGTPLGAGIRRRMETALDADFSSVTVHAGPAARRAAGAVGALAFTAGEHIVAGTEAVSDYVMAHELVHVAQQRTGPVAGTVIGTRGPRPLDWFEREADAIAARVMSRAAPMPAAVRRYSGAAPRPAGAASFPPCVQLFRHAFNPVQLGTPAEVYFVDATRTQVYAEAEATAGAASPRARQVPTQSGPKWQYRCQYCVNQFAPDYSWYFGINTDIDHINPFGPMLVAKSPHYPGFNLTLNGLVDWADAQSVQAVYNDLDNLQIACPGHNRTKGANLYFDVRNKMSIAAIMNMY